MRLALIWQLSEETMYRLTPRRQAVLDILVESPDHPTAAQVFERVRQQHPGIGAATVYRTLGLLVAGGQARVVPFADGASARYDANTGRHDHVVCVSCGTAVDIAAALPASAASELAAQAGFDLVGYELQIRGRCPACRRKASTRTRKPTVRPRTTNNR
jgi:Fur family ferric uptake transcriptional regulator/Fur family peroxide stress response transcriptional regulator